MKARATFESRRYLSSAYREAFSYGLVCLEKQREIAYAGNPAQRRQVSLLLALTVGKCKYNLTHIGQGYLQINFFVWAYQEKEIRQLVESHRRHERYKLRTEFFRRRRGQ